MKAAIYVRVSTTDKGQSTDNQLPALLELVEHRGWDIYKVYKEEASAAGNTQRKQFALMMENARRGRFDILVFWSLDRFSREGVYQTLERLRQLDGYGVRFLSAQEQYLDTLGPFREAVIGILAAVARLEHDRISERVKAGMKRAKKAGVTFGRKPLQVDQQAFLKACREGWSLSEMSRAFSISRPTVIRRRREWMD